MAKSRKEKGFFERGGVWVLIQFVLMASMVPDYADYARRVPRFIPRFFSSATLDSNY